MNEQQQVNCKRAFSDGKLATLNSATTWLFHKILVCKLVWMLHRAALLKFFVFRLLLEKKFLCDPFNGRLHINDAETKKRPIAKAGVLRNKFWG